jgi:hypothetical protein
MLKYVSKFALDILPSVVATIIGAYIVNHYIANKPDAPAAAIASTPETKKTDPKSPETPADVASIPESGIKAKGISEKALLEKTASEKPVVADRVQPALREKPVAKTVQTSAPAVAPVSASLSAAPSEAAAAPEEKRDANDLARAAIERLRGSNEVSPRAQEAVRGPEAPRTPDAARVMVSAPAAMQPLPPPVMVSTPGSELNPSTGSISVKPSYGAATRDNPQRLTPPADIPSSSSPIDLRAEAALPLPREHTSVADDVLSAAKSVFHAVLPR